MIRAIETGNYAEFTSREMEVIRSLDKITDPQKKEARFQHFVRETKPALVKEGDFLVKVLKSLQGSEFVTVKSGDDREIHYEVTDKVVTKRLEEGGQLRMYKKKGGVWTFRVYFDFKE